MSLESGFNPIQNGIFSGEVDLTKVLDLSVLKDKTILITGGASGFGAACAKYWAGHGANLMIGDVNTKLGLEVVAGLRTTTGNDNHHFFKCDVSNWESQAAFFKDAARASPHGGIDVVIANAGIADPDEGRLFESPPDYSTMDNPPQPRILRTIDINLSGVFITTHLALSYLPRNPGSKPCSTQQHADARDRQLILVSSVAGLMPIVGLPAYAAAKHGVVGLFRSLRITAPVKHGVRINMINPYFIKTPMTGIGGQVVLSGGALGDVKDIVAILTRFVTDQGIIGRGCVVASKGSEPQTELAKLSHSGPVWDVYADDFGQTDLYTRRIIGLTNIITQARGRIGIYRDIFIAFTSPIFGRIFG